MMRNGKEVWLSIFNALKKNGRLLSPRGQKTIEIEDFCVEFDPLRDTFCTFTERNLSLRYLAGEFAWYLGGDRNDLRIEEYSSFWKQLKNDTSKGDAAYNSNYGHYFFKEGQYGNAVWSLKTDKDSRQACIMINRREVLMSDSKDKLCTNAVMFRIRDNKLNMTVQMRSNDVIFGLGIDAVMFGWIYEMMLCDLRQYYPDLQSGRYFHTAASFHIYERHFEMMDAIIGNGGQNYEAHDWPLIKDHFEVSRLRINYPKYERLIAAGDSIPLHSTSTLFMAKLVMSLYGKYDNSKRG